MAESTSFETPGITDDDIRWASRLLGLPDDAFFGQDMTDRRQHVIKSMVPMDVAACPGSGKTTLLVAKLAILAEKWQHRTRGICVLSHTNAARHEIETRLGRTSVGRRLLSYPHFIGTIHGFVDEFLALPWLRSLGYPIKLIDTDICQALRWSRIAPNLRWALEKKHTTQKDIRIVDGNFNWAKKDWKCPVSQRTPTYQQVKQACLQLAKEGYHCYDDMFIWAKDLICLVPDVTDVIRGRFPVLFIDEAQDNSEEQSSILHRIFTMDGNAVVRQRFGDENQAIFDSVYSSEAFTDRFPDASIKTDIPNSYRFGQKIADLADPLGINPYDLRGHGPKVPLMSGVAEGQHTMFLFGDSNAHKVLDAYGELLIGTFSEEELRQGSFRAVGQIHRDNRDDHAPRHVGHYWSEYEPVLNSREPKPNTFMQYVIAGIARAEAIGESYAAVDKVAEGILRLAGMTEGGIALPHPRYCHRYVSQALGNSTAGNLYGDLIDHIAIHRETPSKAEWIHHWASEVRQVAEAIGKSQLSNSEATQFLEYTGEPDPSGTETSVQRRDNIYRFSTDGKHVNINVGSIHSVKGETHTAVLVLETFWNDNRGRHNLQLLLPWLNGSNYGAKSAGQRQQTRLKVHYVAMTRPTHLLCLAMNRTSFVNAKGTFDEGQLQRLVQRGWRCITLG